MLLDLHIHQDRHSMDSQLNIDNAIIEAKAKGLSGICITDHDDLGLRQEAELLSERHDFLVIVGVEIYSLDGDLLCYGIDEMPEERLSAEETIAFVHERGGICIAAHPYRHNNRGLKDKMYALDLDAIEGYNGRTRNEDNERAVRVAREMNLPITGSSDAHSDGEIGAFTTYFEVPVHCEEDFLQAIKSGQVRPYDIQQEKSA